MRRWISATMLALFAGLALPAWSAAGESDDVLAVMKMMPADWPMTVVIPNFQRFDDALQSLGKRVNPSSDEFAILKELKGEIGVGDAVDFTKPFGFAIEKFGGSGMPVVFARIPDAATKVKAMPGAKQDGEVWQFGPDESKQFFAKVQGEYVVVAPDKDTLNNATKKESRTLADEVKSRTELLTGRDMFVHLNFDPIREMALGGVAQFGQMAPMVGMMMAQQAGGADPAMMMGAMTTLAHAAKQLVEQFAYIDLSFVVDAEAARLTIATGYKDGPIKSYLAKNKPAGISLLAEVEEQPYLFAMGYHLPGGESPFIDYFMDQMKKGATPGAGSADPSAAKSPMEEGLALTKELFGKVEGMNQVMSMGPGGMRVAGDYVGSDTAKILELNKKMLTSASSIMKQFSAGMTYEAAGSAKIGEVTVDKFNVKLDSSNPAAAQMKAMLGDGVAYAIGVCYGRVRFCMGDQKDMERTFAAKAAKPLSSSAAVKAAMAKLPENRNGVILLEPAGVIAMMSSMMGSAAPSAPAAPYPAAISFSVSGHPAGADIYLPIKAIEQVMAAVSSKEPS